MPEMMYLDHEQVRILVLDTKNQVMENISRYQGTVNSSVLRAAEIYRAAVIRNCPAVIVCRNHNHKNAQYQGETTLSEFSFHSPETAKGLLSPLKSTGLRACLQTTRHTWGHQEKAEL